MDVVNRTGEVSRDDVEVSSDTSFSIFDILCNKKTKNVCQKGIKIFEGVCRHQGGICFDALTAVVMQVAVFWLVSCSLT